ncbi:STAS domain-containing protein [Pseudonocardia humida]|uniref:STAS domain-containing protein n=1 Tax=Pseudonocardia humida TaxID=2800819 RepID=A0ABT1A795_9PSEU|nr:STAS domain-containing protein [Pseudonocardia humida]MCO1658841.1 STAS domain-containing protein [Pseudonocardia humida]
MPPPGDTPPDHDRAGPPGSTWVEPVGTGTLRLRTWWPSSSVAVLSVAGELDNLEAEAVGGELQGLLRSTRTEVVVLDLAAVTFFGSRGLEVVVQGARAAEAAGTVLRGVTGPDNRRVTRPLDITGVDQAVPWFPTADEALVPAGREDDRPR